LAYEREKELERLADPIEAAADEAMRAFDLEFGEDDDDTELVDIATIAATRVSDISSLQIRKKREPSPLKVASSRLTIGTRKVCVRAK